MTEANGRRAIDSGWRRLLNVTVKRGGWGGVAKFGAVSIGSASCHPTLPPHPATQSATHSATRRGPALKFKFRFLGFESTMN